MKAATPELALKIQEAILAKALPKIQLSISNLVRMQARVHANNEEFMRDLASLLVTIHELGGLTKFSTMTEWIINMSGNLI